MKFVKKVKRAGWVIGLAGLLLGLVASMAPVQTNALAVSPDICLGDYPVCQIRAVAGGKCMNVTGAQLQEGALIQQWTCNINSPNSTVQLFASAATPDSYYIAFEHSGMCLASNLPGSGPQLVQQDCNWSKNQRWQFQQVGDGNSYRLYNLLYGRYAHPYPPYGVNGSAVKQQLCSPTDYACNWTLEW